MSNELIDATIAENPADVAQEQTEATEPPQDEKPAEPKPVDPLDPNKLAKRVSRQDRKIGQLTAIRHQQQAEIDRLSKLVGTAPAAQDDGRPKENDFTSVIDYMEALQDWKVEQGFSKRDAKQQEFQAQAQQTEALQQTVAQRNTELDRQAEEFFKSTQDGRELIDQVRPLVAAFPEPIKDVLRRSANPTLAIYNLAKDDGLEDLADMDPIDAAITIHEAQKAPVQRQTKAPAPMASARGRSSSTSPENMDADQLLKWVNGR